MRGCYEKRKVYFIRVILFGVLALCGAGYVLYNKGQVNVRFAVIPMLIEITFLTLYSAEKTNTNK